MNKPSTELLFIQIGLCVMCVFVLYSQPKSFKHTLQHSTTTLLDSIPRLDRLSLNPPDVRIWARWARTPRCERLSVTQLTLFYPHPAYRGESLGSLGHPGKDLRESFAAP